MGGATEGKKDAREQGDQLGERESATDQASGWADLRFHSLKFSFFHASSKPGEALYGFWSISACRLERALDEIDVAV
jgi:hypothetical protein